MNIISALAVSIFCLWLAGCATNPPAHSENICAVFDQFPEWYDYAMEAQHHWGTPAYVLMAFVYRESGYHEDARPPMDWFLFIPLGRDSSAYGYAQIQDPAWKDYLKANGGWFKSRTDMEDALDFVGWYTDKIHEALGISKWDAKHLYIAYHEGIGGYGAGHWRHNRHLLAAANQVAGRARAYAGQLHRCESRFKCHHWYQFWPFCSS